MKKIYILSAAGRLKFFGGTGKFVCRTAFVSKEKAEAAIDGFRERLKVDVSLDALDPASTHIQVVELELDEGE